MAGRLHRYLHRRLLKRLSAAEGQLEGQGAAEASGVARRARQLASAAERLAQRAEARARGAGQGAELPPLPARTDWSARAPLWSAGTAEAAPVPDRFALGGGASIHHDGEPDRLSARFVALPQAATGRGLLIETLDFGGGYLSLSQPLPEAARDGLTRQSLVRAAFSIKLDRPLKCYARINIRNGPNTAEMVRGLDTERGQETVEFDLFYAEVEPEGASDLWLDLIFESPAMARIEIADAVFSRRPRAGI